MKNFVFIVLALAGTALAACSSDSNKDTTGSDQALTDTATFDTSSTDSLKMVDSAVNDSIPVDRTETR
jgi:ABC-type glycerol-3-phosphate transport system substrate-binding protein